MTETIAEAVLLLAQKFPPDWRNDTRFAGKVKRLDYWGMTRYRPAPWALIFALKLLSNAPISVCVHKSFAEQRLADIHAGRVKTIPLEEAMKEYGMVD